MERYVEKAYPVDLTFGQLQKRLRLEDEDDILLMREKFARAVELARPKSVYRVCAVERIDGAGVTIEGTAFKSEVLAKNLAGVGRVFAYVLTCGTEVDDWARGEPDSVVGIWLDMLMELILQDARGKFFEQMAHTWGIEKLASMNPGSGQAETWPIQQQRPLFDLIGNVREDTGVVLTGSMLMVPAKSVSGLLFPSEHGFVNCALCLRENCTGRQAPYDPHLLDD